MHQTPLLSLLPLLATSLVFAQDIPTPTEPVAAEPAGAGAPVAKSSDFDPSIKRVGITVSPIHFVMGFEGAGEFLVAPRVGLVGIFGTGSVDAAGLKFSWREIGGQGRFYFKDGEGFHLGGEVMHIKVELDEENTGDAMAGGLAFGPLLGWKGVWGTGFTFCVQGGYQLMSVEAEAGDESAEASTGIPLLNLDLGWSF